MNTTCDCGHAALVHGNAECFGEVSCECKLSEIDVYRLLLTRRSQALSEVRTVIERFEKYKIHWPIGMPVKSVDLRFYDLAAAIGWLTKYKDR